MAVLIKVAQELSGEPKNLGPVENSQPQQAMQNPHQIIERKKVVEILDTGQISNLTVKEGPEKTSVSFDVERPQILRSNNNTNQPQQSEGNPPPHIEQPPMEQQLASTKKTKFVLASKTTDINKDYPSDFLKSMGL